MSESRRKSKLQVRSCDDDISIVEFGKNLNQEKRKKPVILRAYSNKKLKDLKVKTIDVAPVTPKVEPEVKVEPPAYIEPVNPAPLTSKLLGSKRSVATIVTVEVSRLDANDEEEAIESEETEVKNELNMDIDIEEFTIKSEIDISETSIHEELLSRIAQMPSPTSLPPPNKNLEPTIQCNNCPFTGPPKMFEIHQRTCTEKTQFNFEREIKIDGKPKKGRPLKEERKKYQPKIMTNRLAASLRYKCRNCEMTCNDLRDFLDHLPTHGYEEGQCPCCELVEHSTSSLALHVLQHIKRDFRRINYIDKTKKKADKRFHCNVCKTLMSQDLFFEHWQTHFGQKKIKKEKEMADLRVAVLTATKDKTVNKEMALDADMLQAVISVVQIDSKGKSFPELHDCVVCGRVFSRSNDTKRHLIEHLTIDALIHKPELRAMRCQICGEDYPDSDHYKRHMRDHAMLPIYQCQICDRAFSDSSNFGKHKKVHNLAVLICDICQKKFQSKVMLLEHIKAHEKHKKIECKLCNRVFHFPNAYKKHIRVHIQKPSYLCTICRGRFTSMKDKLDHMWAIHSERKMTFDCNTCQASFRKWCDLKKHMQVEHDEELPKMERKKKK